MADMNGQDANLSLGERMNALGERARAASRRLAALSTEDKDKGLNAAAEALLSGMDDILRANALDMQAAEEKNMPEGLKDRLKLTPDRIRGMAKGLTDLVALPDPVGEVLSQNTLENGLVITKRRVPIGVVGIIYEARPNVTSDAFGIAFKSGNVSVLRGGSDAIHSNIAVMDCIRKGLASAGLPEDAGLLVEDNSRESAALLMKMNRYIDCLIPRGSAGLIRRVVEESTVPVIETGAGNCHIYVDEGADIDMAVNIIRNAKTQRIGVCNAAESLVVHRAALSALLPALQKALMPWNVEFRADDDAMAVLPDAVKATEEDWGTEYLDYILSIKTVDSLSEAIDHINRYHTQHSDAIITNDASHAETFFNQVDSACLYWNASTRFTDGGQFGFGAEIGISTQKLHARGPMALKELTSYHYEIRGNGQVRP